MKRPLKTLFYGMTHEHAAGKLATLRKLRDNFDVVSETEAKNLEKVFGLMVDATKLCQKHEDFWYVLDGEECLVICGRKRVRFDGPGPNEQLEPFNKMADRLLQINGDKNKLQKIMKTVPKVSETLEKYISSLSPSPTKESISSCNIDKDIPEAL